MVRSIPEFVLDEDGTRRFVPSTRTEQGPSASLLKPAIGPACLTTSRRSRRPCIQLGFREGVQLN
jgi:hypothetical protein